MMNIKLKDPQEETIKFYKEQLKIFREENKELKEKAKKAAILVEEEYNTKPFHNEFTLASDLRLSKAYALLTGKRKMALAGCNAKARNNG